jgi:Protein of unknown function (DUF2971)
MSQARTNMAMPKRLYKFRSASLQDITNLSAGKLWFSSPARFNDPFDCAYDVKLTEFSRDDCITLLDRASNGKCNATTLASYPDEFLKQEVRRGLETVISNGLGAVGGVCCFSATLTDLLLWGHYANGHQGFCLEFDTTTDPLFQTIKQVRYSDAIPTVSVEMFKTEDFKPALDLLLTKAECWDYEQEWRVLHAQAELLFGYQRSSLTGVYFGAKMPEDQALMISALLETSDAKKYQMRLSKSRFELVPEEITFTRFDYRTARRG